MRPLDEWIRRTQIPPQEGSCSGGRVASWAVQIPRKPGGRPDPQERRAASGRLTFRLPIKVFSPPNCFLPATPAATPAATAPVCASSSSFRGGLVFCRRFCKFFRNRSDISSERLEPNPAGLRSRESHEPQPSRGNDHIPSGQPKPLETPLKKTRREG